MIVTDDLDSTLISSCFSNLVHRYVMNIISKDAKERYVINQLIEELEKVFSGG